MKTSQFKTDLALVGYEADGSENLSLRLLAGAAIEGGYSARVFTTPSFGEGALAVRRALVCRPRLLGFSLPGFESAVHALGLAGIARKMGYSGFIVCGGTFATLSTDWILRRASFVDGVIRHAGEGPAVSLIRALRGDGDLSTVPSLVTRERANPHPGRDGNPVWRPLRGERPSVLGIPIADVIGGRGCNHRCDYCTHAATASLVVRECREAGVSPEILRRSGLGTPQQRPLADLADEMAELYHGAGVRYFSFIDENPVPRTESSALQWAATLKRLFLQHNMEGVGLGFMTRADTMTPKVVDALVDLGLMRTFVGVESGTHRGLESLGRSGRPERATRVLDQLRRRRVVTLFNSLLLHPDSTRESIRSELDFLATVQGIQFDTVQTRPQAGTRLFEQLKRNGTLHGGELLPSYTIEDPDADRFGRGLGRLHTRVLSACTPTFRVNDLLFSAKLINRFGETGSRSSTVEEALWQLVDETNRARWTALDTLLDGHEAQALKIAIQDFSRITAALDRLERRLTSNGVLAPSRSYRNIAAAAALMFTLTSAPACWHVEDSEDEVGMMDTTQRGDVASAVDGGVSGETGTAEMPDGTDRIPDDTDAVMDDTETFSNNASNDPDDAVGTPTDTEPRYDAGDDCPNDEYRLQEIMIQSCAIDAYEWTVQIDENGVVVEITNGFTSDGGDDEAWMQEAIACYMEILEGETFPCLAGENVMISTPFIGIII